MFFTQYSTPLPTNPQVQIQQPFSTFTASTSLMYINVEAFSGTRVSNLHSSSCYCALSQELSPDIGSLL